MRVISKARLREFWSLPPHAQAAGPLAAWHQNVSSKAVAWSNWSDVRKSYATADLVGNCTVFNMGGNKYRLITRIIFASQKVYVLKVMTHAEYDKHDWKRECGCYSSPPLLPKAQPRPKAR